VTYLAVVLAGAAGAASRFVIDHAVSRLAARVLPLGTLVVNVLGCAIAGTLAGLVARHGLDDTVRVVVGAGFLASFTTYSTFAVETMRLAEQHTERTAVLNVAATLVLTITGAALGYAVVVTA
jgi:fluoride exporter